MEETLQQFRARLHGGGWATYVIMMLIVPLKLWCRVRKWPHHSLGLDDAFCVLALISANAFFFICMFGMGPDLRKHAIDEVPAAGVVRFLKFLFAAQFLYVSSLALIKFSILTLYWRLFSVASRIPVIVGLFFVAAWALSVILVVIFTCDPIQAQWDITITERKCITLRTVYLAGSTPNVITDLIILVLPISYVLRLNAPLAQRLMLGSVFMLGVFVSIVSVVRLTIMVGIPLASPDVTYNSKEVVVWSIVEINVGLICACLPSMRQALTLFRLNQPAGWEEDQQQRQRQQQQQQQQQRQAGVAALRKPNAAAAGPTARGVRRRAPPHRSLMSTLTRLTGLRTTRTAEDSYYQMMDTEAGVRSGKKQAAGDVSTAGMSSTDADANADDGDRHVNDDSSRPTTSAAESQDGAARPTDGKPPTSSGSSK